MSKTTLNVLNTLVKKLNITEDAFYAITIRMGTIELQGYMSTETFQIARRLNIQLEPHPTNSWFKGEGIYEGISIRLCLTIS